MNKENLRREFLKKRNEFNRDTVMDKSECITNSFCSTDLYLNSKTIFIYININSEVSTKMLIERAWKDGKKVAVPITGKNRHMFFSTINSFDGLLKTSFGTMEPNKLLHSEAFPDNASAFIIPGAVFDIYKNRLGYGGGFYDTYFEKNVNCKKIAFAFDFQVIKDELPVEKHDKKMDFIITEKKIIY